MDKPSTLVSTESGKPTQDHLKFMIDLGGILSIELGMIRMKFIGFEGVITKVMYNQSINSTSINTCVMQSTIETRVVKVGDFVIIKEEYILYKGNPFEHVFIFLSINVSST